MTIEEQLREFDLTDSQRYEILEAHDQSPTGLARILKRAAGANNPTAALISMVRKGAHTEEQSSSRGPKPAADTLDDAIDIALRAFNARTAKYPDYPEDDPVGYGVWIATTWNRTLEADDIERGLRKRIGDAWSSDGDPAKRTRHLSVVPDPEPVVEEPKLTLAERLLAMAGNA